MAFEGMKNFFSGPLAYFDGAMRSSGLLWPQNPNIGPNGSSVDPEFLEVNESADASPAHFTPSPKPQSIPVTVPGNVTDQLRDLLNLSRLPAHTSSTQRCVRTRGKVTFNAPLFAEGDFELRVIHEMVCLESVTIDTDTIRGFIRVLNTTMEKDMSVRYSTDNWKTFRDRAAEWVEMVSDGRMDRFAFTLPARHSVGDLAFSVAFNGHRDNNKGQNYTIVFSSV